MKLAALFTDNAILQRDQPVPIWGWSTPGNNVTVEFAGQKKSTVADAAGKWTVTLDPMPASVEPRELQAGRRRIRNVLVGDVWLCSGQSNMEWPVALAADAATEIAAAQQPCLRLLTAPHQVKLGPQFEMTTAWQVCAPDTVKAFSAVAYFFGREIFQQTGVPIGLINCSCGGTIIEAWMSRPALLSHPESRAEVERMDAWLALPENQQAIEAAKKFDIQKWIQEQGRPDPGNFALAQGWAAPEHDTAAWPVMELPMPWQAAGFNQSGVFWFRREINVPAEWAGQDLVLRLGVCDKTDTTYFNGTPVGTIGFETKNPWSTPRVYPVAGKLVRPGRNVIATRVYSGFYQGGLVGPDAEMQLVNASEPPLSLAGAWQFQVEHNFGYVQPPVAPGLPPGAGNPNSPHILYDNMITPLVPAALRGVIWYQGESNANKPREYRELFPLMIRDWRRTFAQAALPFYFVQVANYTEAQKAPVENGWAELREAQTFALHLPQTGMATAIDIGEANDIHPKNKQDVGKRLALAALAQVYGKPVVPAGPHYKSHRIEGDTVRIEFDHAADGLRAEGALKGFVVAGPDGKFAWADARIDGKTVVVNGRQPVAVRYAWANNPIANLYNSVGLPAAPFRTDID